MSKMGEWGDKQIIYLVGDGIRRHKTWCVHYRDGKCSKYCHEKCVGSAHCDGYTEKIDVIVGQKTPAPYFPPVTPPRPTQAEDHGTLPPPVGTVWKELYRLAGWGDTLLGEIVMVRRNALSFWIGIVRAEDANTFTVEVEGKLHKYEKRSAYGGRSVYILEDRIEVEGE